MNCVPLPLALLLRAPFSWAVVPPLALLLVGLCGRLCLDLWALLRPSCGCSWTLRRRLLCRSRSLPFSVRYLVQLPCRLLLLHSIVAYAWARGRSSALCATARGRFVALCSTVLDRSLAPPLCVQYAVFRDCFAPFCSSARGAPPRPLPGPVGAPPPFVRLRMRASPLVPLCSRLLICSVLCLSMLLCRLRLYCSLARKCSPAPSVTARGRLAPCCSATPSRYPAPGAIFSTPFATSCSAARGALTSRTPWPVGAPPFLVRLLLGALLPVALPLPVALLLCVPCFLVVVLPLALAARGAPLSPCLGPWALLRPLCDCSWALSCM